jgi:hypothetical protein
MSETPQETAMTIKFILNDKGTPVGKLAEAELMFHGGPLDGLKLVGFGVWERRNGGRNVTMPAWQYIVNGERRAYALPRSISDTEAQQRLVTLILDAYCEEEARWPECERPTATHHAGS